MAQLPLLAAQYGDCDVVRFLVTDLGADVNQAAANGCTPLFIAVQMHKLDMVRVLGKALGADVNKPMNHGATPLFMAAQSGFLDVLRCLANELGADLNLATHDGSTPLMAGSRGKRDSIIRFLTRNSANSQASKGNGTTAVHISKMNHAPVEQTEYLEAKAHCSNPWCSGAGLKKCTGCKQARYCGQTCQLAHWEAHKAVCMQASSRRRYRGSKGAHIHLTISSNACELPPVSLGLSS
jgi:ankyrin repeat protein